VGTARAQHLFEAYFHQDCLDDDPTWEAVVVRFRDSDEPSTVRATRDELIELLESRSDQELGELVMPWSFFDPTASGLTVRTWIECIVHILAGGQPTTGEPGTIASARAKAAAIARSVVDGTTDILTGARRLVDLRGMVGVSPDDEDFLIFVAIDSETDGLPIGPVRDRWSAAALAENEDAIERAKDWAREFGLESFIRIVSRFGAAG
jgi:hypothetical protein